MLRARQVEHQNWTVAAQAHLPGVLLNRLHPHSLKSRRVQVEPAG